MTNATSTQLQELYVAYFGRAADPTGLDYWTERGITTAAFAANMYAQPEFTSEYGTLSIESQVNQIYKNLFDRDADVAGLTYWSQQIRLGNLQLAEIANDLIWAAQNNSGSADDKAALSNRTEAAVAYTAKIKETTAGILSYQPLNDGLAADSTFAAGNNIIAARNYLSTIDKDTASTAAGIAASVATITSNGVPTTATASKTLTLTTNQDSVTGGAGNDKINGVIVGGATGTTIQAGDVIDGGSGVDTLNIAVSGDAATTLSGVQATGIEKVLLTNFDGPTGVTTVDTTLLGAPSTVGLSSSGSDGDTVFQGMTVLTNAELRNGAADLTLTHTSTAVSGSSDAITLDVSNLSGGTFTAASIETLTINSTLTQSQLTDVVIDNATALNVTGSANLQIVGDVDFADNATTTAIDGTVDASAFTGNLSIQLNTGDIASVTGGSGDDFVEFSTGFTSADVVDGGAGTDTLSLDLGNATLTSTTFANVSNVEVLEVNPTNDSAVVNADGVGSFTTLKAAGHTKTVHVTGSLNAAGDDYSYSLNGVSTSIASATGTNTDAEVAAELAASINALTGFTATAVDVDGTGDGVFITRTSDTGDTINFDSITGTGNIAVAEVGYSNVSFTNLTDQTVEISSGAQVTASLKDPSGTADSLTVNLTSPSGDKALTQTIEQISAGDIETLTINTSGLSANTVDYVVSTLTDGGTNALTTLKITGDSSLDIDGTITASKLVTVDASTFTGDLQLDGVAANQTITTGSGADSLVFGSNLNNADTVDGGAGTDTLSATVTGLTATTGALNVSNVETLNLTNGGVFVFDASKVTGASEIAVTTNTTSTTITNLAAGVKVGAGLNNTDGDVDGLFDISLADSSGTSDSLTFNLNDTDGTTPNTNTIEVKATGIETVTFDVTDDTDTSNANTSLDVDSLNAAKIVVVGSAADAGQTMTLNTLDTDTTAVDATGYFGILTATAGTAIATTFDLKGDRAHNITGSSKNDTFTIGETTNADITVNGNGGTDVLNLTLGDGDAITDNVSDVDTINLIISG
ncbi:hypothetical protein PMN2A_1227 [Prochlorococcus marinus str. NATL2A]|uniref:DUF4214 domain-containing protein n=1 Tax=Prochlorococcus marinus (strain NATL2A) TaxID=59920 RepID=Q46IG1_PROMT|nr:DUF4214 domain-containing protein [Prochlorococcus marinus]AAZ58717.1 hypothetical protein PMN2A_1227 [Prochlorococcus marinus str. NATL2A]